MKTLYIQLLVSLLLVLIPACNSGQKQQESSSKEAVNVKVTGIKTLDIKRFETYYGNTIFLNKNRLTAPVTGYITENKAFFGKKVHQNDLLFKLETREQKALGNSASAKHIEVRSNADGYISELNFNNTGDFVSEGDILCVVTENAQPLIKVSVPFEETGNIKAGDSCDIILMDYTVIPAKVLRAIPMIQDQDQTQDILIKPESDETLPENLNVTVRFIATIHKSATVLPRQAVMTDESQSEFWVMKVSGERALKIPVKKGIENDSLIEITEPNFNRNDLIIKEGSYELPDSSIVNIIK
ncbi:efflux RND transporter periplasmic adaptor subunit [Saccharicrinis sp. FJH54]|uniref:efflux RND transporter periplasmic adaptor subunit n=1 Tax=Saccharicrinis sp. FJH54 TaxID=3344665 RepID=UPI0035D42579